MTVRLLDARPSITHRLNSLISCTGCWQNRSCSLTRFCNSQDYPVGCYDWVLWWSLASSDKAAQLFSVNMGGRSEVIALAIIPANNCWSTDIYTRCITRLELIAIRHPSIFFSVCLPSTSEKISFSPVLSWHRALITQCPRGLRNSFAIWTR